MKKITLRELIRKCSSGDCCGCPLSTFDGVYIFCTISKLKKPDPEIELEVEE